MFQSSIRIHWSKELFQYLTATQMAKSHSSSFQRVKVNLNLGIASLYGTDDDKKLQFAFNIYDIDKDGFISNGELFTVLKMMVGNNLTDLQLQQLVDRTIIKADLVQFFLIFRILMAKFLTKSLRKWSNIQILGLNLKSTKFDIF